MVPNFARHDFDAVTAAALTAQGSAARNEIQTLFLEADLICHWCL